ncbi:MAG: hypothetical protein AB1650_02505 [Candidatus Omnitrophota bacterium]
MNNFDFIFIALLFFFLYRGFTKGFLRSMVGPVCLAFWSIIGIMHYDLGDNIISSVMVTIFGSVISTTVILFIFLLGRTQVHKQHRHYVFLGSRLLGAAANLFWNGLLVAVLATLLSLTPRSFLGLEQTQQQIQQSRSYILFYRYLINPFPLVKDIQMTMAVLSDYNQLDRFKDSPQYQNVFSDPKIQNVINNPSIMDKIYSKDAITLLQTPQIQALLKDEKLMMKVSELGRLVYREQTRETSG